MTNCLQPAKVKEEFLINDLCDCLKTLVQDNYVSCLLKAPSSKSIFFLHNLFECDLYINSKAIVYTQTKRIPSQYDDKMSINLVMQNVDTGCTKKILCHCEETARKESSMSLEETSPTNETRITELVHQLIKSRVDWTLRFLPLK